MSRHGAIKLVYIPDHGEEEVLAAIRADEHTFITIEVHNHHHEHPQSNPATDVSFTFGVPTPQF